MRPILLNAKISGVKLFEDYIFEMSFMNDKRVTQDEVDDHIVERINNSIYKKNVIAVAGLNASGKTTTLRLINFLLDTFVEGRGLNHDKNIHELLKDEFQVNLLFLYNDVVYNLIADIKNDATDLSNQNMYFINERIYTKPITVAMTKKAITEFSDTELIQERQKLGTVLEYLKKEDSIFPAALFGKGETPKDYLIDTLGTTDINLLSAVSGFELEFIQYLDPSIESLTINRDKSGSVTGLKLSDIYFDLKFIDENPVTLNIFDLNRYLSSGTIRGLSFLTRIKNVLQSGGYILIDELEIHFNKIIVQNIISFFQSEVNVNNATLIFSTHYSELLDTIDRKDEIEIVRKKGNVISLTTLNVLAKSKNKDRNEYKNSDLVLSGIFDTSPSYNAYWAVNRSLQSAAMKELVHE